MRRVNLLPPEDRRGRVETVPGGSVGLLLVAAAAVLLFLVGLYLVLLLRLGGIEEDVADLQDRISERNERLAALAPYEDLQAGLDQKKPVADGIFRTRFAWDEFLQGLAFVVPETTALRTLTGEAAPVDVQAPAEAVLDPPGAITFTGVALPEYENVADFVVRMNNLEYLGNAQLDVAELDRETFVQPAITFEVTSELVTVSGEGGTEVRIAGADPAAAATEPAEQPDLREMARREADPPSSRQYAAGASSRQYAPGDALGGTPGSGATPGEPDGGSVGP